MSNSLRFRTLVMPAALILGASTLVAGCGDEDGDATNDCGVELGAKINAFNEAADDLVELSVQMKGDLAVACAKIASDLGDTTVPATVNKANVADADVTAYCNAASARLRTAVSAAGSLTISVEGGQCRVDARAQLDCEGKCTANAECKGGDLSARCDPGELSVECSGECKVGATCQGSADVAAKCEGTCDATCTGTCDGACTGTCDGSTASGAQCAGECEGKCEGTCSGTCKGNCEITGSANVQCGAEARCKGGCTVEGEEPRCEVNLEAPQCQLEAECQASCEGNASVNASCEPIRVVVVAETEVENLESTLEANWPAVVRVLKKGPLAIEGIVDLGGAGVSILGEVGGSAAGCIAAIGGTLSAQGTAIASATASVNVSVQASASVSGSASGGT